MTDHNQKGTDTMTTDDLFEKVAEAASERVRAAGAAVLSADEQAVAREFGLTRPEYSAWRLKDADEREAALEKLKPPAG